MTHLFRIDVGHSAHQQVDDLNVWWQEHRGAAPTAVHDELLWAFRLILNHPHIGRAALDVDVPDVRGVDG